MLIIYFMCKNVVLNEHPGVLLVSNNEHLSTNCHSYDIFGLPNVTKGNLRLCFNGGHFGFLPVVVLKVYFVFDIRYVGLTSLIPFYSKHILRHSDHVFNIYMTGDMLRLCLTAAILEFGLWLGADICFICLVST